MFDIYGVKVHSSDGKNTPIYPRQVTDADLCNWKDKFSFPIELPSQHKIGDKVKVCLMPQGEMSFPGILAYVVAVHFTISKVKYDVEVRFDGNYSTRIYNVDSILVLKPDSQEKVEAEKHYVGIPC